MMLAPGSDDWQDRLKIRRLHNRARHQHAKPFVPAAASAATIYVEVGVEYNRRTFFASKEMHEAGVWGARRALQD